MMFRLYRPFPGIRMPPTAPSPRPAGLAFIFVTVLLDVVGFGIIIPVMPRLVSEILGGDLSQAATTFGFLASSYTLLQFLCAPALGALSDQVGRKPVLLYSLLLTAIAYAGTAMAPNLTWLFAARALAGAAGGSLTVATTYIADISPPEKRAQNFGLIGAAFGIGFILGPAVGGLLGGMGLRMPFYAAGAVALLNFLYGLVAVPESHRLENRNRFTWQKANPIAGLALLRGQALIGGLALALVWMRLAQSGLETTWVLFTTYRFNWSVAQNGASLAVVGICAAVVQGGLIRRIMPVLGERRAVRLGLVISMISFLLYGLATEGWMMYGVLVLGSFGGIAGPALQGLISKAVSPQEQGRVQGTVTSLMSLVGIVAPLVGTNLFARFHGRNAIAEIPGIAFFTGAVLFVAALVTVQRVFARNPDEAVVVTAVTPQV
jgi:DHA1 family tetracycline resistance protein-like MFS transporter